MIWKKSSTNLIDLFNSQMDQFNQIERKKMFGYPCAFYRGHLFTGLHEDHWILKLSEEDREEISNLGAKPFKPLGRTMKEYVILPQELVGNPELLTDWIKRSLEFLNTKPKKLTNRNALSV